MVTIRILEKIEDDRGWLVEAIKGLPLKQVIFVKINPGKKRGNHYHKERTDYLYIIGEGRLELEDMKTGEKEDIYVEEPRLIIIPPLIKHTIINPNQEPIYYLEGYDKEYNEKDVF